MLLSTWHILAIVSVVFSGLFSFVLKVAAERTHSSPALNMVAAIVSSILSLAGAIVAGESLSTLVIVLGIIDGLTFIVSSVSRSDALKHIDATLFFPLYKIVGPTFVAIAGMALFDERLSVVQAIGLALALAVPLLLIDAKEHGRQKDLRRGVWLLVVTAACVSTGALLGKVAMNAGAGVFTFSAIAYLVTVLGLGMQHADARIGQMSTMPHAWDIIRLGAMVGLFQFIGFVTLIYAFRFGPVSTTYAINSTYIVIPIILSIWYYGEHWSARKVIAIALSIGAVILLR